MKAFHIIVSCLIISVVSAEETSKYEKVVEDFTSGIIENIEKTRDDCPSFPERSVAEEQLKKCTWEFINKRDDIPVMHPSERLKVDCELVTDFLECSESLVTEVVNCGKNLELITMLGLVKGLCQYENQFGIKALLEERLAQCDSMRLSGAIDGCKRFETSKNGIKDSHENFASFLETACPFGKIVKHCATFALKRFCPQEEFVEFSNIYENIRSLSGNPTAFDRCLTGPSEVEPCFPDCVES